MYTVKRPELKGKLSARNALIQAGLDRGWSCFIKHDRLENLEPSERDYLHKAATSYFLAGDPVIQSVSKQYHIIFGGK